MLEFACRVKSATIIKCLQTSWFYTSIDLLLFNVCVFLFELPRRLFFKSILFLCTPLFTFKFAKFQRKKTILTVKTCCLRCWIYILMFQWRDIIDIKPNLEPSKRYFYSRYWLKKIHRISKKKVQIVFFFTIRSMSIV